MVKGKGTYVLDKRMKSLDPDLNKSYKFLGCGPAESVKVDEVNKKVSKEME